MQAYANNNAQPRQALWPVERCKRDIGNGLEPLRAVDFTNADCLLLEAYSTDLYPQTLAMCDGIAVRQTNGRLLRQQSQCSEDVGSCYSADQYKTQRFDEAVNAAKPPSTMSTAAHTRSMVRFGCVKIRIHGTTVGAFSACNDSCPLQLTWEHDPVEICLRIEDHQNRVGIAAVAARRRMTSPSLQRLSIRQRRTRISNVQGITVQAVAQLEYDTAMKVIQDTLLCMQALQRCSPDLALAACAPCLREL
jgi:hypothetical protein